MAFTFFFRDQQTLNTIVDKLIPVVMGQSKIQIWDAGCASGEEPYSLAILLAEKMGQFSFKNLKMFATDINPDFGEIIKKGVYPYSQLQRIPRDIFNKYFEETDKQNYYKLSYKISDKIVFQLNDLRKLKPIEGKSSLIICKNVLLHQTPTERVDIIKMFYESLKIGGILAMEQTQKLPDEVKHLFEPLVKNAQIFKRI